MDCSSPGSSVPFSPPADCPNPGIEPTSPALESGFFITEPLQPQPDSALDKKTQASPLSSATITAATSSQHLAPLL